MPKSKNTHILSIACQHRRVTCNRRTVAYLAPITAVFALKMTFSTNRYMNDGIVTKAMSRMLASCALAEPGIELTAKEQRQRRQCPMLRLESLQ